MARGRPKTVKKAVVAPVAKKGRPSKKKAPPKSRARMSVGAAPPNNEFEVEEIMDFKGRDRGARYLIKWKGYPHRDNTWEPLVNLENCDEALIKFYDSRSAIVEEQRENGEPEWEVPPNPRD